MRAIKIEAVHAAQAEGRAATRIWLVPLQRITSVCWGRGTTTIYCEDGLVLEADDPDMRAMMEVENAFERDHGVYAIGGGWRYWYVDSD